MPRIYDVRFERKWQDLWVGAFWKTTKMKTDLGEVPWVTEVWICFVPCFPLCFRINRKPIVPFNQAAPTSDVEGK